MTLAETAVKPESTVDPRYTWNRPSVFPDDAAWEAEYAAATGAIPTAEAFRGRLSEGPAVLAEAIEATQALNKRVMRLFTYATMATSVDSNDQEASKRYGRANALYGRVAAASAFVDPELLAVGAETLRGWVAREPALAYLAHYVDDLFRRQAHVRSSEVEELLGMLSDPMGNVEVTRSMLTDADFRFPQATAADGSALPVTQGSLNKILSMPDREARRSAWEGYMDTYLAYKNTLAANLTTSIKNNVFTARARRHSSTLSMALHEPNIPEGVYRNLIAVFQKNLPTWHRYWEIRRKALGVETLQPYDIWAPLNGGRPRVAYDDAVELICAGLAPLGQDYVDILRRGCREQRWVDVYPTPGKIAGAFSSGSQGTYPFIMMSYTDEVFSLSTLAHELGHSMHSHQTWANQPYLYSGYSLFVAEVASNFHQAMVRAHLLQTQTDPTFQLAVIEEAMSNFHRYFFIMPTLARFELEIHEREERGEGLSADDMIGIMADLFAEGYGGKVNVDRERTGITWATFGHLYIDYYVFQYATGISGANALARRILDGTPGAADDYLKFLRAGSSLYPVDALKLAGVDITSPAPVEAAFQVLSGLVDRLEGLLG